MLLQITLVWVGPAMVHGKRDLLTDKSSEELYSFWELCAPRVPGELGLEAAKSFCGK